MPDFGVEQMEVVAQGLPADPTVLGGIDFPGSPMLQVDLIHIIDQVHDGLLGDVITEPPAEFGGEIVFPVGKSPGAPESPHNAAGGAADAFFHFSGDDGTAAEIDGVAFFQDQDTDLGIFQDKFISGINGGRAPADNGYIDFFFIFEHLFVVDCIEDNGGNLVECLAGFLPGAPLYPSGPPAHIFLGIDDAGRPQHLPLVGLESGDPGLLGQQAPSISRAGCFRSRSSRYPSCFGDTHFPWYSRVSRFTVSLTEV